MKLTFESNLNYQQEAIKSITDLFEGQPSEESLIQSELSE
jgi:type III restriction enzyme